MNTRYTPVPCYSLDHKEWGEGDVSDYRAVAAAPPPQAAGIGDEMASHALGYVQPEMAVAKLAVSVGSAHPFPTVTDDAGAGEKDGGGKVTILAVAV